jgi:hypothetical protein
MKRPFAAVVTFAAIICSPLAAHAATANHHKLNHVALHRSVRGASGMPGARTIQSPPVGHWCIATNIASAGACGGPELDRLSSNG